MKLAEFNTADPARAAETLRPCIDVQRWVDTVADRPALPLEGSPPGLCRGSGRAVHAGRG